MKTFNVCKLTICALLFSFSSIALSHEGHEHGTASSDLIHGLLALSLILVIAGSRYILDRLKTKGVTTFKLWR